MKNPFAEYNYEALPWVYIGYTGSIIKSPHKTDAEKVAELTEAMLNFNQRWSELSGNELSV